jgi:hypothetical protein
MARVTKENPAGACPPSGWMQDAGVAAWARSHSTPARNLSDHAALFSYFADQVEPIVTKLGKVRR